MDNNFLTARGIPQPPLDPEARRLWKERNHAALYGISTERFVELTRKAERYNRQREWQIAFRFFFAGICIGAATTMLIFYLKSHGV